MRDLSSLPKTELHIHLEGSIRIETARELADRDGSPLPHGLGPDGWRYEGFLDFIENYVELCSLVRAPDDFRRIAEEFCADLAENNVPYAEAVFSPSNHAERLGGDWYGPIEAVLDGLEAGRREHGVTVRLCPDIVRDLGMEQADRVLEVALTFADRGVVALNAAGSERAEVGPFAEHFRRAKAAGLRSVPHAGEWAGAANIWATLDLYEPDRIGHGIRAIDDARLVEHLAERAIPLEISPVSNVATGAVDSLEDHPLRLLRDAGVVVTLNSDDPSMFGAWTADVYRAAREAWGFDDATLAELAAVAVIASFADDATKAELLLGIEDWLLRETVEEPTTSPGS